MLLKDLLKVIESNFVKIVFVPEEGDSLEIFSGMVHCYKVPNFEQDYRVCGIEPYNDGIRIIVF